MDNDSWKEIFHSIREGNIQSCFLLNAGLDINALSYKGTTMLSYAAECGNLRSIQFLVQKGADSNVANLDGSKPLHVAAKYGHLDVVKFFLNLGLFVDFCDENNSTPLHYVSQRRDISVDVAYRYVPLVHFLLDNKADLNSVNQDGCRPLLLAARNSRKDIVDLFIKLGANVECCDKNRWTLLHYSSRKGWLDIVRFLVERVSAVDLNATTIKGDTPLIIASLSSANTDAVNIVNLLIESGANVECRGFKDWTVLHYACIKEWLDVVKCLVNRGCDINAKTFEGYTPLLLAARNFRSNVQYLIESGADVKCCDRENWTALHFACDYGWIDVVKSLIKKGSDLNAQEYNHDTPLHVIVRDQVNHLVIIELLLKAGADCNIKNYNGKTSFSDFIRRYEEIAEEDISEEEISDRSNVYKEGIGLFIKYGACFEVYDYVAISDTPSLKESILRDEMLCSQAVINKFNNADLPKIFEIPVVASRLPSREKFKIVSNSKVAHDIALSVKREIQTNEYCNVLNVRYIALSVLCVKSLFEHYCSTDLLRET